MEEKRLVKSEELDSSALTENSQDKCEDVSPVGLSD